MQVGAQRCLDLFPDDTELKLNALYRVHLMTVHTFLLVKQIGPGLQLAMMEPDWLKKYLDEHPSALKHEKVEEGFVLTAQPKEMQAFLAQHVDKAFGTLETLRKLPAAGDAAPAKAPAP